MAALDRWERRLTSIAHVIPYFVLTVTTVVYSIFTTHPASERWFTYGVVAFGYAWMVWWFTLHPAWHKRTELMAVFIGGMVVFYAVLGLRDHWFGAVSFAVYLFASEVLRGRWMFFVVAITAALATLSLFGGYPPEGAEAAFWLLLLIFVVVACTFTYVGHVTTEQSRLRKELLEENEGLHAQLLVQAHEAGVQDERHRLAGEIHDTLAQGLAGIITQLSAATPADWERRVAVATGLARTNLTEARRSVHALRPPALDSAALHEALDEVAAGWSALNGVPVSVTLTGSVRETHPEVEVALLRTAQEALANVAKHASASRVGLTLSYMEDVVTLDVRDDGVGFDLTVPSPGFGLPAMRHRVHRLSGALFVESEPGAGTAISARVPA
ncbi:sensor histidine kinase [Lentzea sp. DG1S-22]|uniref:sensor histidine kinase n=1 Tax=unclassified Lentzea TaxID=2643253 RepID=UPI001F31086D|nr:MULTISPECIES: sensor histidine kinase [unclassified Lentzea]MCG8921816.1 sensor histidine kinase [Lentzea sp. CC55]WVH85112.1 sensor histidine kinase [Lentzea sp. DG1S-22]